MYRVGIDIAPGLYRNNDSSEGCYWVRLRDFGGRFNDIIANEYSHSIQIVRIFPTDRGFKSEDCGVWKRIGD